MGEREGVEGPALRTGCAASAAGGCSGVQAAMQASQARRLAAARTDLAQQQCPRPTHPPTRQTASAGRRAAFQPKEPGCPAAGCCPLWPSAPPGCPAQRPPLPLQETARPLLAATTAQPRPPGPPGRRAFAAAAAAWAVAAAPAVALPHAAGCGPAQQVLHLAAMLLSSQAWCGTFAAEGFLKSRQEVDGGR